MKDAGSGETKLAPKFSPAIAVQKQPTEDVLVTLRAGDPPGPWWLAIQKGFGPVYIEQVGFDAKVEQRHLKSISLLLDGRVSIFGLTAAVDDLSLTFVVASNASVFDPTPLGGRPRRLRDQLRPRRHHARRRPAQVHRAGAPGPARHRPVHRHAARPLRRVRAVGVRRLRAGTGRRRRRRSRASSPSARSTGRSAGRPRSSSPASAAASASTAASSSRPT